MKDKHDPREFEHWTIFNDDGTVAATTMIAMGVLPDDGRAYVKTTAYASKVLDRLVVPAAAVTGLKQAQQALAKAPPQAQKAALAALQAAQATLDQDVAAAIPNG